MTQKWQNKFHPRELGITGNVRQGDTNGTTDAQIFPMDGFRDISHFRLSAKKGPVGIAWAQFSTDFGAVPKVARKWFFGVSIKSLKDNEVHL